MTPSIHCQASRPEQLAALVAVGGRSGCPQLTSWEMAMPMTIAACWKEPSRPR